MSHQMLYSLEGYLDNIAAASTQTAAATQTAANGVPLADLAASLELSVDTVSRQQIKIKNLTEHNNSLKKKGGSVTAGVTKTGRNNSPQCKHYAAVGRTAPHRNNKCYFDQRKNKERMGWAKRIIEAKRVLFNDE